MILFLIRNGIVISDSLIPSTIPLCLTFAIVFSPLFMISQNHVGDHRVIASTISVDVGIAILAIIATATAPPRFIAIPKGPIIPDMAPIIIIPGSPIILSRNGTVSSVIVKNPHAIAEVIAAVTNRAPAKIQPITGIPPRKLPASCNAIGMLTIIMFAMTLFLTSALMK